MMLVELQHGVTLEEVREATEARLTRTRGHLGLRLPRFKRIPTGYGGIPSDADAGRAPTPAAARRPLRLRLFHPWQRSHPELPSRRGPPRPQRRYSSRRSLALLGRASAHVVLAAILALSGVLEFVSPGAERHANAYYSAGIKSMLRSWHDFFYISAPIPPA